MTIARRPITSYTQVIALVTCIHFELKLALVCPIHLISLGLPDQTMRVDGSLLTLDRGSGMPTEPAHLTDPPNP